jgi:hypothetical protein
VKDHISYEDFMARVDKYYAQFKNDWKYGQTYFNVLTSVRGDIADSIRGTIHDPFHKNEVSKETEKLVKSRW